MERREDKREKTCVHARGGIYRDTEDNVVVILESVETTRNRGSLLLPSNFRKHSNLFRKRERENWIFTRAGWNCLESVAENFARQRPIRFDSLGRARDYSSPLSGAYGAHRDYNIRELPREYCFDRCLFLSLFLSFYPRSS